jgi:hypothetical protein
MQIKKIIDFLEYSSPEFFAIPNVLRNLPWAINPSDARNVILETGSPMNVMTSAPHVVLSYSLIRKAILE